MIIYLNVGNSNHLFLFCKGGYDMQKMVGMTPREVKGFE